MWPRAREGHSSIASQWQGIMNLLSKDQRQSLTSEWWDLEVERGYEMTERTRKCESCVPQLKTVTCKTLWIMARHYESFVSRPESASDDTCSVKILACYVKVVTYSIKIVTRPIKIESGIRSVFFHSLPQNANTTLQHLMRTIMIICIPFKPWRTSESADHHRMLHGDHTGHQEHGPPIVSSEVPVITLQHLIELNPLSGRLCRIGCTKSWS